MNIVQNRKSISNPVKSFLYTESLYGIGIGLYSLVFNLHLLALGINERQIGIISSVGILVMGGFSLPIGMLATRWGRKRLLIIGELLCGLGFILLGSGSHLGVFYIAQIIISVGFACIETTEIQLLFHYCSSRKQEMKAFNLMFALFTAFTGLGYLLSGILSRHSHHMTTTYQLSLYAAAGIVIILALVRSIVFPREPRVSSEQSIKQERIQLKWKPKAWGNMVNRELWIFAINALFIGFVVSFIGPFANLYLKFRAGWADAPISYYYAFSGVLLFIVSILTPWMTNRWKESNVFFVTFACNMMIFFLLYFSMPNPMFACLLMLRSGSFTLLTNLVDSYSMSSVREKNRNVYAGMRAIFRSVGSCVSLLLAGYFLSQKDYSTPFIIAALLIFVNFVFFIKWVFPYFKLQKQNKELEE